jgi:hypothetical protein
MVPSNYRRQAQSLLKEFNRRGNELTWNSDGIIFIDEVSIPNSDIYVLFPNLFKKNHPKNLPGFQDFVQKLNDMGLDHLISQGASSPKKVAKNQKSEVHKRLTTSSETPSSSSSVNWWYLG